MDTSKTFETEGASLLAQSDGCAVWQFRNATGDGTIAYTAAGDMKLDLRRQHTGAFNFPSCHYHGLTVAFDLDIISHSLSDEVKDFPVTPVEIITRFSLGSYPRVLHKVAETEHIFSEMYRVPEKIRIPYFKVKILELLLYLDAMTIPANEEEHPYFYRTQVEKVKAIKGFLTEHLSENYTQEELSRRFDIPMTPMKTCFRSVYGEAIGTWLAGYRMNQAAELLLRERDLSIAVIDWRLALASLITFPLSFLCMGLTFKISGKNFEKYDQSANYMNSTIVEYIEGIEVIKAFGRAGSTCRDAVDLHGRLTRQAGGILRKYASGKVHGRKLRGIS